MFMKHFVNTVPKELCDNLIAECKLHDVDPYHGNMDLDPSDKFYEDHLKQKTLADKLGYTSSDSVEFRHYYPQTHFDVQFVHQIEKLVGARCLLCFVSEIRPGKCAPWHWDINPWLDDYPEGSIERYVSFIDTPKHGQAFMIEDECFYMEPQGNIYKFPELDSHHAGFNAGLDTKFLFTFTGVKSF